LPREKHAPRGYAPAQLRATLQLEVPGIVQLGAKVEYLAKLEVSFAGRDAYPFEIPTMRFTHPALRFEEAAAVNRALHAFAATKCGSPHVRDVLEWCEGDDVPEAVERAREAARAEVLGASGGGGGGGETGGGHLARTLSKLRFSDKAADDEEERAEARR
jgi:ATP-dependent RNA helicase DHX57